jgi:AcrR family transcriptional regulator
MSARVAAPRADNAAGGRSIGAEREDARVGRVDGSRVEERREDVRVVRRDDVRVVRRDGVERERLSEIQRARILKALVELAGERGAANVVVSHIVARAGVSRRTFYEIFADRGECFVAAFEEAVVRAHRVVEPAYAGPGRWRERVRGALVALLGFLENDPDVARLLVVESLGAGQRVLDRRAEVTASLVAVVEAGCSEGRISDPEPGSLTAEATVGAVLSLLHARLARPSPETLLELVNPLMAVIVLPYLGSAAARAERDRPVPHPMGVPERRGTDPLRELEMRLTYRTVRVLMAVAASPGASNRRVGENAGIADQGQISKLLARLRTLCLVENPGQTPARGEANAWTLTTKGWEVHNIITQQTTSDATTRERLPEEA